MKIILLLIALFTFFFTSYSQPVQYNFLGALSIKGDRTYSYTLNFTDSNNTIKGYSITDVKGKDETKTAIYGTVSTSKKELRFNETYLIYTKSAANKDSFCYVHTKLKMAERKGTKVLKGSFKGYKKGGKTECAKGSITMIASEDILNKLMKIVDTMDTTKKALLMEKIKELNAAQEKEAKQNEAPGIIYLLPGNKYELICKDKNVQVELWDNEKIDGDVISLKLNDRNILDHYSLVSEPKLINITLPDNDVSVLTLIANAEGAEPPNTVRMKLTSGKKTYLVQASTTLGEGVQVMLKKE